jgi:nitrite reductase/ring-hydroxylating ferredoxin subunit
MTTTFDQRIHVGRREEFADGIRRLVDIDGVEVGVLQAGGELYAFENRCVHQGGPVCEGSILGRVECLLDDEQRTLGSRFSDSELHLICPWHGFEYRLPAGECVALPGVHLRRYEIQCEGEDVYVVG